MPLDPAGLQSALESIATNPPPDPASCAQAWAAAVQTYASGIVPLSTTVGVAGVALASALATAFQASAAAPGMETAFAAFAAAVGGGMAGYTPTPPPGQVGFAAQFASPHPPTHAAAAAAVATRIDTWMRTGIATLAAPPNTVVPWS